ncbi:MAG: hypothetical protein ACXV7J_06425, partial [Methylomonas sp.]
LRRLTWGEMRMEPIDLADDTGAIYHFLINGQTQQIHKTYLFKTQENCGCTSSMLWQRRFSISLFPV